MKQLIRFPTQLRLAAILLSTPALVLNSLAHAQVTIRVVSADDGSGIPSTILRRNGGQVSSYATDASGQRTFAGLNCTPDVSFKIRPRLTYYPTETEWTDCESTLTVRIPRARYAQVLTAAFHPGAASMEDNEAARSLRAAFITAAEAGDTSLMAVLSTQLQDQYLQLGRFKLANIYEIIAIDSRYRTIAGMLGKNINPIPPVPDPTVDAAQAALSASDLLLAFERRSDPLGDPSESTQEPSADPTCGDC